MPTFSLASLPDTVHAGRIRYELGWANSRSGLHRPALYYIFSGKLGFTLGEKSVLLCPGDAFLLLRDTAYSVRAEEDCDYCYFHFHLPELQTDALHFEKPSEPFKRNPLPPRETGFYLPAAKPIAAPKEAIEHLAVMALRHAATTQPFDKARLDLTLLRLLLLLAENARDPAFDSGTTQSRTTYLTIREYIEAHYTEPLSLSEIAQKTEISPQYASRVFRRYAECSVTAFVQHTRLSKSEELLRYTSLSVSQIAYAVGFSSPYYYCRLFRKHFGITPTDFRRAAKEEL